MNINGSLSLVLLSFYINNTYSRMYLQYIADNATFFDLAGCPKKFKVPVISCVVCFLCDGTHSPAHPSCGSPKSTQAGHPKWLQADMTIQALWGDGAMILQSKYIYIYIYGS